MKTEIKDEALEMELQELYLTGRQWLSDLEFLATEEGFLREHLLDLPDRVGRNLFDRLDDIAVIRKELGQNIADFINKVGLLIVGINSALHLQLIEDFASLQAAVTTVLGSLKGIKYALVEYRRVA